MNSKNEIVDILVIGGGINGCGIAHDAASRGLNVMLCEMNDLASATSSASSKLIHGGLRYLEHYEFRLVKEALAEREVLLKNAPHIMWPLTFVLPHRPHLRPAWMIRAGLFLYDNLSKRQTLAGSKGIKFGPNSDLKPYIKKGFNYSDGWVDDARLTVLNALAAKELGADIRTQTKVVGLERQDKNWLVTIEDQTTHSQSTVQAKLVVNAAGPWVEKTLAKISDFKSEHKIRLVKGSHVIVPRFTNTDDAYILQNEDQRIVFVLPYEDDFNLVGTTDVDYQGDPKSVAISQDEIDYLIEVTNEHFNHQISQNDIKHTYSGVRPLLDDESSNAQQVTRDYTFKLNTDGSGSPLLTVYGGKITTYRKLSEACVDKMVPFFTPLATSKTRNTKLPGGNFYSQPLLLEELTEKYPYLPAVTAKRWVKTYGTYSHKILANCQGLADMGMDFGHGLFQVEVDYLKTHEWAKTVEDIIWRRTKLGLFLTPTQQQILENYLSDRQQRKEKIDAVG